jgi:hypothetical protein
MPFLQKAYLGSTPLFREIPFFAGPQITDHTLNAAAVTVTASATPHTKGAWSEIIASTSSDVTLLSFVITNVNTTSTDTATLIDIGVGAAGSETVVVPDIAVGAQLTGLYTIPVKITSGTRIAMRSQSVVASKTLSIPIREFFAFDAGDAALTPTTVDVLGVNTATSEGTAMSGASGTWVEITASTAVDYSAFAIVPSSSDGNIAALTAIVYEIGVGAAGSEVSFGRVIFSTVATEQVVMRRIWPFLFGREVPSGSRLSIRHNIATNPDKYDACIIAIPKV